jgi:3-methyladenine DNA glycosylase AlkD
MTKHTLAEIRRRLLAIANPSDAQFLQGFFKTGAGQYGDGDRFLGIRVPATRALAKEFRDLSLNDVEALLHDKWHEARLLALILLAEAYERGTTADQTAIYQRYLRNTKYINNWDLVDSSAAQIVGAHLLSRSRAPLYKLVRSKSLWERRIAIVATFAFIRDGELDDSLKLAELLLTDTHDLMHKATGWVLREVGKSDEKSLLGFLDTHAAVMPRTMLRYALERLSPTTRKRYMNARAIASRS